MTLAIFRTRRRFANHHRLDRFALSVLLAASVASVVMVSWAALAKNAPPSQPAPPPRGCGYWTTSGAQILDCDHRRVRIAGVTWYGAESTTWVPAGLDFQPYTKIMRLVKKLGYNVIRLAFSNEMVERDPIIRRDVAANPEFLGKSALDVFDAIVTYARQIGLKIILDDQRSSAAAATVGKDTVSKLDEPLWYTKEYSKTDWLRDWETLTRRYLGNPAVIGFDLRNEPHTDGLRATLANKRKDPACRGSHGYYCPWDLYAYLHLGSTWGPYNGHDNPASDWRRAAENAGNALLKINNSLLIFVEGLQLYPMTDQQFPGQLSCGSSAPKKCVDSYWWGGILRQVRKYPITLSEPTQLVYSPHEYGPARSAYQYFNSLTYASFTRILMDQWAFITQPPKAPFTAPIFIGEMGTCTQAAWCLKRPQRCQGQSPKCIAKKHQAQWLHYLIRFLHQHKNIGWSLWTLNGTNAINAAVTDGLLNPEWNRLSRPYLQKLLSTIQSTGS